MRLKSERVLAAVSSMVVLFGCTGSGGGADAGTGRDPKPKHIPIIIRKFLPAGSHLQVRLKDSVILNCSFSVDIPDSTVLDVRIIPLGDTANAANCNE